MRLSYYLQAEDVPHPVGWKISKVEDLYEQLPIGVRRDKNSSHEVGAIPIVDQSKSAYLGFHDDEPGVLASPDRPVVTFANHTCAMRVMTRPFSVIQNVFPKIGRDGVCDTLFLYYTTNGRTQTEEYKGHHPQWRSGYVPLPPLPTQHKVAAVLSAYDDLIANNTRRIAILEDMARTIYREWFVEFRYPGHETVPLVESELGPNPQGWQVVPLGDQVEMVRRNISAAALDDHTVAHYSFGAHDGGRLPIIEDGADLMSGKLIVDDDSVLLGKLNPKIKRIWRAYVDPAPLAVTSGEFLVLRPTGNWSLDYLYSLVDSDGFQGSYISFALGTSTSHQRVKPADALAIKVVVPMTNVVSRFSEVVEPVYRLAHTLRLQNERLRSIRDFLLPRLVSGEVDVSDLDIDLGVVA